jgi:hypothetical protein
MTPKTPEKDSKLAVHSDQEEEKKPPSQKSEITKDVKKPEPTKDSVKDPKDKDAKEVKPVYKPKKQQ